MGEFCDAHFIPQYGDVPAGAPSCHDVCQSACLCLNPCNDDCLKRWEYLVALDWIYCDVPCEDFYYRTHYQYFCENATCTTAPIACCPSCSESPVVIDGPLQHFRRCPESHGHP